MIRRAIIRDLVAIRGLPVQLGVAATDRLDSKRFAALLGSPDQAALVYIRGDYAAGFLAMRFFPDHAVPGNFAIISYFAVERPGRDWQEAGALEDHAVDIARGCRSAFLLSKGNTKSPEITRFLLGRGYAQRDNHFIKSIS